MELQVCPWKWAIDLTDLENAERRAWGCRSYWNCSHKGRHEAWGLGKRHTVRKDLVMTLKYRKLCATGEKLYYVEFFWFQKIKQD